MDHLPHPSNPKLPPVIVPYYSKYKFDGGNFTDFPKRCGFSKEEFRWGDFHTVPLEDHTAFSKAWLFFGIINDFFATDDEAFINHEKQVITTAALPRLAKKWQRRIVTLSHAARVAEQTRVWQSLREARDAIAFLDDDSRRENGESSVTEEVAHSIVILVLTLEAVRSNWSFGMVYRTPNPTETQALSVDYWPITELATKRLLNNGRCRSDVFRLRTYMMAGGVFYCASLESNGRRVDHDACSTTRCMAEDVVEADYMTQHDSSHHGYYARMTNEALNCDHTGPNLKETRLILESGTYPIIAVSKTNGVFDMGVNPYRKSTKYTAISHSVAQKIPLSKLSGGFSKRPLVVYFWIDTLAIPLEHDLRKKAIALIHDVYKSSEHVLVLDQSLFSIPSDRPLEELCFRLSSSPWTRRAWRLQEGALAQSLYVQSKDTAVDMSKAEETLALRLMKSEPTNRLLRESCMAIGHIQKTSEDSIDERLSIIPFLLQRRTTSHAEDMEIVLAVMLDMNMDRILNTTSAFRTAAIYKQMSYIPQNFLWSKSERLNIPGLQWAPRDIVDTIGSLPETGMKLTPQGLLTNAEGMVFRGRTVYLDKHQTYLRDSSTGKWYLLRWVKGESFDGSKVKSAIEWTVLAVPIRPSTMLNPLRDGAVLRLDDVLTSPSPLEIKTIISSRDTISGQFIGIVHFEELDLAEIQVVLKSFETTKGAINEYKRGAKVERSDGVPEHLLDQILKEDGDDSCFAFEGIMCEPNQKWCIT